MAIPAALMAALMLGAAIVAGAAVATDARAQSAAPGEQQLPAGRKDFSEQDLKSYASAAVKVQDVSTKWQEKLKTTKGPAAGEDIQKQAEQEAVAVVKQEGLTVEKYNRIALATENDPEIRNKVMSYMKQK
jgi:predicted nucleic acid-binding Zn ribbon protein